MRQPHQYLGQSKHLIAFPISTVPGKMVNMVAFVSDPSKEGTKIEGPWMRPAEQNVLLEEFQDWMNTVPSKKMNRKYWHGVSHIQLAFS